MVGPGNVVAQRIVKIGQAIGDKWVVTDGLKAGDRLIVDGLLNLHPGDEGQPATRRGGKLEPPCRASSSTGRSSPG